MTADALVAALQVAVPLRITELEPLSEKVRNRVIKRWAAEAADSVAYGGDVLQYGSKRRGEVAGIFNALAKGIAAGAYVPGGVTVFGEHWCVDHAECLDAAEQARQRPLAADPEQTPRRPVVDVHLPEVA